MIQSQMLIYTLIGATFVSKMWTFSTDNIDDQLCLVLECYIGGHWTHGVMIRGWNHGALCSCLDAGEVCCYSWIVYDVTKSMELIQVSCYYRVYVTRKYWENNLTCHSVLRIRLNIYFSTWNTELSNATIGLKKGCPCLVFTSNLWCRVCHMYSGHIRYSVWPDEFMFVVKIEENRKLFEWKQIFELKLVS